MKKFQIIFLPYDFRLILCLAAAGLFVLMTGCLRFPGDQKESNSSSSDVELTAVLSAAETFSPCDPVVIEFTLKNISDHPLYLLPWNTPFEGMLGNIFKVTHLGYEREYLGPVASRRDPDPSQYLYLEPGEERTTAANLSQFYDFTHPGIYQISFHSPYQSHTVRQEIERAQSTYPLGPVKIPSNTISLEVLSGNAESPNCPAASPTTTPDPEQKQTKQVKNSNQLHTNSQLGFSLELPAHWACQQVESAAGEITCAGKGFISYTVASQTSLTLEEITNQEAHHVMQPYGPNPKILPRTTGGQPSLLILPDPAVDNSLFNIAELIVPFPHPVNITNLPDPEHTYLLLYLDVDHAEEIITSVKFFNPEGTLGE